MNEKRYLTAKEAAAELDITLATLYAYVSRGLIRSEETEGKSRAKRYRREDVEALKRRKALRRNPAQAAEDALHWGMPVLESGITLIANGRFYYRGHDALHLAQHHTIEEVAALIWTGNFEGGDLFTMARPAARPPDPAVQEDRLTPMERFQVALPLVAARDLGAYDLNQTAVSQTGARIMQVLTAVAANQSAQTTIAETLQRHWLPDGPETADLLNTALVLCADHELNVSSFTARCVASAGSTPYAVVAAGMAALQGAKHGGYTERVEALFREAGTAANARATITSRLRRGEGIPGFGHKLYPQGDPRGRLLLNLVGERFRDDEHVALAQALVEAVEEATGDYPTVDFGLVALTTALRLSPGAALALFALGRTVGWIGHAIEQYQLDQLIRPRARYTGPQPQRGG